MPSSYPRAARVRKDVLRIVADDLRGRLDGNGPPVTETHEAIDTRIATEIDEAIQDALRETRRDD